MRRIFNQAAPLIAAFLLLTISWGEAQGDAVEKVLSEIEAVRGSIHTFSADFVVKKEVDLFASAITSKGRLIMRPPDLLIWKVEQPLETLFFVDRGTAGTSDSLTGEVKRWDIGRGKGAQPAYEWLLQIFMGTIEDLKGSFRIEIIEGGGELLLLRLVPKSRTSGLVPMEIRLGFDPGTFLLKEITIEESLGDRTEINLEKIEVNGDILKEIPSWLHGNQER